MAVNNWITAASLVEVTSYHKISKNTFIDDCFTIDAVFTNDKSIFGFKQSFFVL